MRGRRHGEGMITSEVIVQLPIMLKEIYLNNLGCTRKGLLLKQRLFYFPPCVCFVCKDHHETTVVNHALFHPLPHIYPCQCCGKVVGKNLLLTTIHTN